MPAVLDSVTLTASGTAADNKTAKEVYEVLYDIPDVSATTARNAAGLPAYDAGHPDDSNLVVIKRRAKRVGMSGLFKVEVDYSNESAAVAGDDAVHPLLRPTKVRFSKMPAVIEVDTDAAGNIITNSAGQVQKIPIQFGDVGLTYTQNEASLNTGYADYWDKTNTAIFKGYAIGQVLCVSIEQEYAEEIYKGAQVVYYVTTYTFAVAMARFANIPVVNWQARLLDAGTMQKEAGPPAELVPIRDGKTGANVSTAVPLDGNGVKLAASGVVTWNLFTVYGTKNFAPLGL